MSKEIKTRNVIKDIKVFDRAADVSTNMKNSIVKTKSTAEKTQDSGYSSPSEYASDTASNRAQDVAHGVKDRLGNPHKKAQQNINKAKDHFKNAKQNLPKQRKQVAEQAKQTTEKAKQTAEQLGRKAKEAQKTAHNAKKSVENAKRAFKQTRQAGRQTIKTAKQSAKSIKHAEKTIKTGKNSIKATKSAVKTANRTAKTTIKTAQKSAVAAKKSAIASAKAAKAAAIASKAAAKAAIIATKLAIKVTIATVKAAIAAVKGLIALIAAGGWIVLVVILVICLVAMVVGSVFGIFFSGEETGEPGGRLMPDVVAELTVEFYDQIEDIQNDNAYDEVDVRTMSIRWDEVLAVYAVKVNTDPENGMDVVTLDDDRIERLRGVLNDMVSLSYSIETETRERTVTTTDDDGNETETTETVTVRILVITMEQKSVDDISTQYGFNQEQRDMLDELLDPQHADLWAALLGGFSSWNGENPLPDGNFIPTGMFSWPMGEGFSVNSPFGYRTDPITGERSFHSGVDIPAPEGTPILAMADGTVIAANSTDSWGGGWGFFVRIQHEGGYETLYAHCSRIAVVNGQEVRKGDVIGFVGSTGRSTGPHLHFEVWRNGVRVNPLNYFQ